MSLPPAEVEGGCLCSPFPFVPNSKFGPRSRLREFQMPSVAVRRSFYLFPAAHPPHLAPM